jgi:8-oxo-dGTP pyrophosphatase MutT (NUDIX family)
MERYTWDGQPISRELPHGVSVVVYRRTPKWLLLLLHRAHNGADYDGDWAWTPPSGARHPGEAVHDAARRELYEEAGLSLCLQPTPLGTAEWSLYVAEAHDQDFVVLVDPEHDRYVWVTPEEAVRRVEPAVVKDSLIRAVNFLQTQNQGQN